MVNVVDGVSLLWGLDAEDNPLMKVSQRRSGGCWCGLSTLDGVVEGAAASERFLTTSGKWPGSVIILQPWSSSLCEPRWQKRRFGRLLVSRTVGGNDRTRTLTGILTSWSRGSGRRSASRAE